MVLVATGQFHKALSKKKTGFNHGKKDGRANKSANNKFNQICNEVRRRIMRINVLQHTPNEGPGYIQAWAHEHGHELYIYHPYQFGIFPTAESTDMLVVLGGPMSVNDDTDWIKTERKLIKQLIDNDTPIFGACFGAQQIAKTLGYQVIIGAAKEVGWAPVTKQTEVIPGIPAQLEVLHWHQEVFQIPEEATLLFSSKAVKNQGFVMNHRIVGLQFHFEPTIDNVREMVVNDAEYLTDSIFKQSATDVLSRELPSQNKKVLDSILDYISK